MNGWLELDDNIKAFRSINGVLKEQGAYLERAVGFFASRKVLKTFSARIYTKGLEKLLAEKQSKRVLLIPNHRSYLDPLIIHQILTLNGNKQPRVAALDFIAATPLAPLFEKLGAVYIKESFSDPDYREKMNVKLRNHLDNGEWLEFYLEGRRSLSGKQMDPRHGMLKAMMDKDCIVYPVNFSYERLIEDRDFISKSKGFNLATTCKSLFVPGKGAGNVYVTFGDPVYTNATSDPAAVALAVTKEIMKNSVLQGTDIIATVLLNHQEHITYSNLQTEMDWLAEALRHRGVAVAPIVLDETLALLKHAIRFKNGVVSILDKTLLIYYRNRALYSMIDLVDTPSLLRKELLWSPSLPPRVIDRSKLVEIAKRAIEPTIFLYKYLLQRIVEGETSVSELRKSIEDNPHCCYELVTNLCNVLKEDGIIVVDKDLITLKQQEKE